MRLHTPVVLTDNDATAALARARKWPVVRPHEAAQLRLTGVAQQAPLPELKMDIAAGSLSSAADGWAFVLAWIEKYIHLPMLVTTPDSWGADLARWAAVSRGWPARVLTDLATLSTEALLTEEPVPAPPPAARLVGVTRVLLVASNPASARARMWLDALGGSGEVVTDLVAPVPAGRAEPTRSNPAVAGAGRRAHVVPDHGLANLAGGKGALDPVYALSVARAVAATYDPLLDPMGAWQVALERWFEDRDDHFDVVVLMGRPSYFGFAAWAQRNWYARTVLDYGEPFSDVPGLSQTDQAARAYWERGWNLAADAVTVPSGGLRWAVASGPDAPAVMVVEGDASSAVTLVRELGDHSFKAS